jgi:predicted lysophospholipase L1 biosynthesis ABC-type transport system permease subunit
MSGWLRHFVLNAQVRTGFGPQTVIWAVVAAVASMAALIFLTIATFIWLADRYDALIAGLVLACFFILIALIAIVACLITRRRNMERARLELAARRSNTNWLDPKLMAMGLQIGQTIGWRKLASLAAVGLLAAGLAREWSGHDKPPAEDDAPRSES